VSFLRRGGTYWERPASQVVLGPDATAVEVAQQLVEVLRPLMNVYLDAPSPWYSAGQRKHSPHRVALKSRRYRAKWGHLDDTFALYSNALRFLEQNGVKVDRGPGK